MSETVELPPSAAIDGPEPVKGPPFELRRLIGSTACVGLLVLVYITLLRASGRAVLLADSIQNQAPKILFALGLAVAAGSWIAPAGLREAVKRVSRHALVGPVLLAGSIGMGITPALVSWRNAGWAYSKLAGALPWGDANAYHVGGQRLLNAGRLDDFNSRRPLNAGFYAVRMAVTGQNFWATMLIQGALVGVAGYLVIRVVVGRLGVAAGLVVAAVLFSFIRPLVDVNLSESLGLVLGCLALAALWHAVDSRQTRLFALGLLTLTVALNVRAGAYFALPALLIWLTVDTLHARRRAWKPIALGFAAVLGGFVLNMPITALYSTSSGSTNANFSFTLYGLAHGGTGWTSAYEVFDPSDYASEAEHADAVYDAAFAEIRAHPGNLVRGILKAYDTYLDYGVYGFAPSPVSGGLTLTMLAGLIALVARGPTRRLGTMVLVAWCGIILSVPFIFEDGWYRVMAATMPLLAVPPAACVALMDRGGRKRLQEESGPIACDFAQKRTGTMIAACCIAALVVLVVGPPVAVALHDSPDVPDVRCARDETPVVAEVGPQVAHITILAPGIEPRNFGEVTYEQFHANPSYYYMEMSSAIAEIEAGSVMLALYNLIPGASVWDSVFVVAPASELPTTRSLVALCGRPSADPSGVTHGLVFTRRFEVLER